MMLEVKTGFGWKMRMMPCGKSGNAGKAVYHGALRGH